MTFVPSALRVTAALARLTPLHKSFADQLNLWLISIAQPLRDRYPDVGIVQPQCTLLQTSTVSFCIKIDNRIITCFGGALLLTHIATR